jgi:predicted ester cyclase
VSLEDNKAVYRAYVAAILSKDLSALDSVLSPQFVGHDLPPGLPAGPDSLKEFRRLVNTAFPDQSGRIEDIVAEGDRVVGRISVRHTHRAAFRGIPPSGRQVESELIEIVRIEGGKVAERWVARDPFLGALPPAAA